MKAVLKIAFLVSFVSFAILISIPNPSALYIFVPLFVLLYGIFPIAGFYIKRAKGIKKIKSICREHRYTVTEKKTLRKAKHLVIETFETQYFVTLYSVFRSFLNIIIKSENEISVEYRSPSQKMYAIKIKKWNRQLPFRILNGEVEFSPESKKRQNKQLQRASFAVPDTAKKESKVIIIYPPVQNVYYKTKTFETDNVEEPMYNGCSVGSTTLYSMNGFCELLNALHNSEG